MYKKALFLVIILIFTVSGIIFSQNAQELRVGGFFSGYIGTGQEIWYSVRAVETGVLTVETMGDTDTFLTAYDSNRNFIAENDDGDEDHNARINLNAVEGRTYLFKLRGFGEDTIGSYRIFASQKQIIELHPGTSYNGRIIGIEEYWFRVRAPRNGILVTETSGEIDTMLVAYDNNFNLIDSDDDSGTDYNAKLEIRVQTGAAYIILLKGFFSQNNGPYTLTASIR